VLDNGTRNRITLRGLSSDAGNRVTVYAMKDVYGLITLLPRRTLALRSGQGVEIAPPDYTLVISDLNEDVLAGDGLQLVVPETRVGALVLQDVPLGELPFGVGVSAQLDAGASASSTAAEDAARWCLSTTSFGDELGTPGSANESCPTPLTGE